MPASVGIHSWVLMPLSPWHAVQLRAMNAPRWGSPAKASRIVLSVQAISDGICAGGCAAPRPRISWEKPSAPQIASQVERGGVCRP
jgi:hypothetical protein